jgi:hypothetical protein
VIKIEQNRRHFQADRQSAVTVMAFASDVFVIGSGMSGMATVHIAY